MEALTIYDRLAIISDKLRYQHKDVPSIIADDLNGICDELYVLDEKLCELKESIIRRPVELTQAELGEISEKLV